MYIRLNALHSCNRKYSLTAEFRMYLNWLTTKDIFYLPTLRHPTNWGIPATSNSISDDRHVDDVISGRPTAKWVNNVLRCAPHPVADMFIVGYFWACRPQHQRLQQASDISLPSSLCVQEDTNQHNYYDVMHRTPTENTGKAKGNLIMKVGAEPPTHVCYVITNSHHPWRQHINNTGGHSPPLFPYLPFLVSC